MIHKIYEYQDNGRTFFNENAIYCGYGWELEVELPDFLKAHEAPTGDTVIEPEDSYPQFLSKCLRANDIGKPSICVTYGKNAPTFKYYGLKVLSRKEVNLARYL